MKRFWKILTTIFVLGLVLVGCGKSSSSSSSSQKQTTVKIGVVGADDGNDRFGVGLDVGPARAAVGLVADLVDDIVRVPQGAGHGAEELLGGPLVREGVRIR
ncbi:MAG: hypothetical protein UHK99_11855, partial [Lacticaseibacillus paracasei]|nr:hypothetical protein [Lacticaseibacillus paracasei]